MAGKKRSLRPGFDLFQPTRMPPSHSPKRALAVVLSKEIRYLDKWCYYHCTKISTETWGNAQELIQEQCTLTGNHDFFPDLAELILLFCAVKQNPVASECQNPNCATMGRRHPNICFYGHCSRSGLKYRPPSPSYSESSTCARIMCLYSESSVDYAYCYGIKN